jgi:hypothetical protein
LLRRYITPEIGTVQLGNLTTAIVRQWRADLLTKRNVSETVTAKAYRLLRACSRTSSQ